ncbi:minor tail protein [Gordonia phage WilliamBoone]|nr:minor tail protein [Gordonia phage WilliamBoone]
MADITYQHVTGKWTHLVEDGMVDLDSVPDEVGVTGHVRFIPVVDPKVPAFPTGDPTRSVSLSEIGAVVVNGEIEDHQGRPGVWLAATIGGRPVRWTARATLNFNGVVVPTRDIVFLPPETGTELHLNDVIDEPEVNWGGHRATPVVDLNLPTVGDYAYTYRLSAGEFNAGAELYYLFGDPPTPAVRWDFDIETDAGSILKTGVEVAAIAPGTRYWLMFRASPTSPLRELLTGSTRKVNA